jgi:hypothetical protein
VNQAVTITPSIWARFRLLLPQYGLFPVPESLKNGLMWLLQTVATKPHFMAVGAKIMTLIVGMQPMVSTGITSRGVLSIVLRMTFVLRHKVGVFQLVRISKICILHLEAQALGKPSIHQT